MWCWYNKIMVSTRSCSSALRGACSSCVLVIWLCGQRAGDALLSLVARLLFPLCRPEGMLLCTSGVVGAIRELTLCHRWSHALILFLYSCGVGTAVAWYLYSLLLARSCVLVVLVKQYGIYTRSFCSVTLKACSFALAVVVFVGTSV